MKIQIGGAFSEETKWHVWCLAICRHISWAVSNHISPYLMGGVLQYMAISHGRCLTIYGLISRVVSSHIWLYLTDGVLPYMDLFHGWCQVIRGCISQMVSHHIRTYSTEGSCTESGGVQQVPWLLQKRQRRWGDVSGVPRGRQQRTVGGRQGDTVTPPVFHRGTWQHAPELSSRHAH